MKQFIKHLLSKLNLALIKKSSLDLYEESFNDLKYYSELLEGELEKFSKYKALSHSQIGQDLFVLLNTSFKKGGFFVEFGATNGVDLSNTYLLEQEFNWKGILAEPNKAWHEDLKKNRLAAIETDCVWKESNLELDFNHVEENELSTLNQFSNSDKHSNTREKGVIYPVKTISLLDLLIKHHAPKTIDYLSIDTEGSEYEILKAFDFNEYDVRIITCEHNKSPMRSKIHNLLKKNGYQRRLVGLSQFDDWYIKM